MLLTMFDQIASLKIFRLNEEVAMRPTDHTEIRILKLCIHHPKYDTFPVIAEHCKHQWHIAGRLVIGHK